MCQVLQLTPIFTPTSVSSYDKEITNYSQFLFSILSVSTNCVALLSNLMKHVEVFVRPQYLFWNQKEVYNGHGTLVSNY